MIRLTRFDGTKIVLNCDIIQYIEATPDTIITQTTGDKIMVKEKVDEITDSVIEYKQKLFAGVFELNRDKNTHFIE